MREEYRKELAKLKAKMVAAEAFAKKLPLFAERIIAGKLSEKDSFINFGDVYKQLYLGWGIKRIFFAPDNPPINYKGKWRGGHLFSIYINSLILFDDHDNFGLWDATNHLDVFHRDYSNSTFYVTDENIEPLLEALNCWVIEAFEKLKVKRAAARIEKARKELAELEQTLVEGGKS